eukprot:Blabericola_migrator_1__9018@NODE_47_length_16538_cov_123_101147_g43_i0_p5_GENE_NODE_47_length_16538_cov_123_101147_g43_i0NODE_47_length_16538_cov_123_101147_g43_i0_p5_ORF_typecomplete_len523_score81_60C2/PF00168_30/2_8e06C2/PF00168_30/3_3e07DUF2847/PF11009_8/2DUF2847/PF11009_8/1_9e02_NODE_47_length_16538_cov_123_101147_g43_i054827050
MGGAEIQMQHFNLLVSVHKGQDLEATQLFGQTVAEPFVQIKHSTTCVNTKVAKTNRSPDWNTQFVIPAVLPTLDSVIRISLFNGETAPSLYSYYLVDFEELTKRVGGVVQWINFYWRPPNDELQGEWQGVRNMAANLISRSTGASLLCLPWDTTPQEVSHPTQYAGRVLVSLVANRVQIPAVISSAPSGSATAPPTQLWLLDCQVLELASIQGNIGPLKVELVVGPHSVISNPLPFMGGAYKFPPDETDEGKLETLKIYLPTMSPPWDLFFYVRGMVSTNMLGIGQNTDMKRAAYARMPLRELQTAESKPFWTSMLSMDTDTESFRLLLACRFGEEAKLAGAEAFKMEYKVKDYVFRAFVYEASNLQCPDSADVFPTAYVRVEIGGKTMSTRSIKCNVSPAFYEAFEERVSLHEDLALAPEINIDVFHQGSGFFATDEHIGHATFLIKEVPKIWETFPRWLNLTPLQQKNEVGKVLCSFELVSVDEDLENTYVFFDDIRSPPCGPHAHVHSLPRTLPWLTSS